MSQAILNEHDMRPEFGSLSYVQSELLWDSL